MRGFAYRRSRVVFTYILHYRIDEANFFCRKRRDIWAFQSNKLCLFSIEIESFCYLYFPALFQIILSQKKIFWIRYGSKLCFFI